MGDLPACCRPSPGASLGEHLYCAYNAGGERPGLNYQGLPCPLWADLPEDIRWKWTATAVAAGRIVPAIPGRFA